MSTTWHQEALPPCHQFIDIGANLTDPQFQGDYHGSNKHRPDIERVLQRAKENGVQKIIVTAGCMQELREALELVKHHDPTGTFLYTTLGVHPTRCNELLRSPDEYLKDMIQLGQANPNRIVAVGEMGLDFDRLRFCDKNVQIRFFKMQLERLTHAFPSLPLFLHMRNACREFTDCIRSTEAFRSLGVVHSFTGDRVELDTLIMDLGFDIGLNGCSLKTQQNLDVAKLVPLERLHFETDSPWCEIKPAHASWNLVDSKVDTCIPGKWQPTKQIKGRNEPSRIVHVSQVLAKLFHSQIKDVPSFYSQVFQNSLRVFSKLSS